MTVLEVTVEWACERFGIERLGFLTLTFADHVTDKREAQRRFNSLATNVLGDRYQQRWLAVWERQKSGRFHAHLLVALDVDIRTGCDFDAFLARDYRTAPPPLRDEWLFWRQTAPKYRFGRTEMLPVKSSSGAISTYVGKYLGKDLAQKRDAGVRRYAVGKGFRVANQNHQPVGSMHWRRSLAIFAKCLAYRMRVPATWEAINAKLGPKWIWAYRDDIAAVCDAHRRSVEEATRVAIQLTTPPWEAEA